jgi:glycosyltransferase involved in cell wall biosynthesis
MHRPLVSIVIAVHNEEKHLPGCLDSVLEQDYSDIEIIVVNDGSTDHTAEVLKRYQSPKLRAVYQPQGGQSAALNVGSSLAAGQYVKFVDADDVINAQHIRCQVEALAGFTEHLASCRWVYFSSGWKNIPLQRRKSYRNFDDAFAWLTNSLSEEEGMMGGWLWLIPRPILERAGGWDERLSLNNDFDFSIRLLLASQGVRFADGARYYYRKGRARGISQSFGSKALESAYRTTELGCRNLLAREDSPLMRRLCANRFQSWLFLFYPAYPELVRLTEAQISLLGGSSLELPGGKVSHLLKIFFTWKQIRWLQLVTRRLGWAWYLEFKEWRKARRGSWNEQLPEPRITIFNLQKSIIALVAAGFFVIIVFVWIDDLIGFEHYLFGTPPTPPQVYSAVIVSAVTALVGAGVARLTLKLMNRIKLLEAIAVVCSHCGKQRQGAQWVTVQGDVQPEQTFYVLCPNCTDERHVIEQ